MAGSALLNVGIYFSFIIPKKATWCTLLIAGTGCHENVLLHNSEALNLDIIGMVVIFSLIGAVCQRNKDYITLSGNV